MTVSGAVVTQLHRGDGPSETIPETPEGLGETRTISGVTPFLLNDAERATYVVSGEIDLFMVEVRDGKPYGARHYLCSFTEGGLLLGFDGGDLLTPIGLLAVGSVGAAVSEFPIASLRDLAGAANRQARAGSMIDG